MYPGRVLVADSNPLCRGGVIALVRGAFGRVTFVEAGDAATMAAELSGSPIDLAAVDLDLPGFGGAICLRALRERHPDMRVIALAWADDGRRALEALAAGAHGYIPKTLTAADMLQAFRMILSGQIYVPASVSDVAAKPTTGTGQAPSLTERQTEVLRLLAAGQSNKEIARALNIAEGTVKVHVMAAFKLLGVHNRVSAAAAIRDTSTQMAQPFLPGLGRRAEQMAHRDQGAVSASA